MSTKFFKHFMPYELQQPFEVENSCTCGAVSDNNWVFKPDLLGGPIYSKCQRHKFFNQKTCFNEWAFAIPLGDCKERRAIERLVTLGRERDALLDRLEEVEKLIKGDKNED